MDGQILLPRSARQRAGIQPVASVTARGASRAEVGTHEEVTLQVHAAVPPGAGTPISVTSDLDGSGSYPVSHELDGTRSEVTLTTTWCYERPRTYFATAFVESHREGDVKVIARRIPNVAAARVVVS